jgi:predicted amidohydrolase
MNKNGEIGRVYKSQPASFEAFRFKGKSNSHIIKNVPIGNTMINIGIAICYENALYSVIREFAENHVDLILSPFCAPKTPKSGAFKNNEKVSEQYDKLIENLGIYVSNALQRPVVSCNKCGQLDTTVPGFGKVSAEFPGCSNISVDGKCIQKMGNQEGFMVETIEVDKEKKINVKIEKKGRFIVDFPTSLSISFWMTEIVGGWIYSWNSKRKMMAVCIANGEKFNEEKKKMELVIMDDYFGVRVWHLCQNENFF